MTLDLWASRMTLSIIHFTASSCSSNSSAKLRIAIDPERELREVINPMADATFEGAALNDDHVSEAHILAQAANRAAFDEVCIFIGLEVAHAHDYRLWVVRSRDARQAARQAVDEILGLVRNSPASAPRWRAWRPGVQRMVRSDLGGHCGI